MKYGILSTQFCAGEMAGGKDTCKNILFYYILNKNISVFDDEEAIY